MKIQYIDRKFSRASSLVIQQANDIINDYRAQGYDLSLRQLYYQFVSKDLIPNRDSEYKKLGSIINDARLAGLVDWSAITDRGRNVAGSYGVDGEPQDRFSQILDWLTHLDRWKGQKYRPEIWVEKDALSGVVGRVSGEFDVPYIACKGYMSQSEMWAAGRRLREWNRKGQIPIIIHLGDHDPSGKDMSRDIEERLMMFAETYVEVRRIALNWDQIQTYNPPPNPAKITDSRAAKYIDEFGDESWELDALDPATLADLMRDEINDIIDLNTREAVIAREEVAKRGVQAVSDNWEDVITHLRDEGLLDDSADEEGDESEDE